MRPITTIALNHDDCRTLSRIRPLLDVAFPLRTEPLAPADRSVTDDHPLRRALAAACSPYDPLTYDRVLRAWQCLDAIRTWVVIQADETYWLNLATNPHSADNQKFAAVLAAERRNQRHLVAAAIEIIETALESLSPLDDPRLGEKNDFRDLDEIEMDLRADEALWWVALEHTAAWVRAHHREPSERSSDPDEKRAAAFLAHQRDAARGRRFEGWSPMRRAALDEQIFGWGS